MIIEKVHSVMGWEIFPYMALDAFPREVVIKQVLSHAIDKLKLPFFLFGSFCQVWGHSWDCFLSGYFVKFSSCCTVMGGKL